jgi:putative phage-type endonuclease
MIQGTDEWHQARLGKVTASGVADVMASGRGGKPSATRANYEARLVAERLSGRPTETFQSAAMQHGTETEGQARACYALETGNAVAEVGFVDHPTIAFAGASPDGLVGDDGLVEIKCPNTATHIATLLGGSIPDAYMKQMQFQMACTGRKWCDFVSFDPRMPDELQLRVTRVPADPAMIAEIETAVREFLGDVTATIAALSQQVAA